MDESLLNHKTGGWTSEDTGVHQNLVSWLNHAHHWGEWWWWLIGVSTFFSDNDGYLVTLVCSLFKAHAVVFAQPVRFFPSLFYSLIESCFFLYLITLNQKTLLFSFSWLIPWINRFFLFILFLERFPESLVFFSKTIPWIVVSLFYLWFPEPFGSDATVSLISSMNNWIRKVY